MYDPRFWSKVLIGDDCWEWVAAKDGHGYGRYMLAPGRPVTASRHSYAIWHGAVPEGLDVLHRCDNPPCVRPDHLYTGTGHDNMRDMVEKGRHYLSKRTHCLRGHPFDEANTYRVGTHRKCRRCMAIQQKAYQQRRSH